MCMDGDGKGRNSYITFGRWFREAGGLLEKYNFASRDPKARFYSSIILSSSNPQKQRMIDAFYYTINYWELQILKINTRLQDETVWLSQAQLCELFQKSKATVSEHIKNVFEEGELDAGTVVRNFRTTASDGKSYDTNFYNQSGDFKDHSEGSRSGTKPAMVQITGRLKSSVHSVVKLCKFVIMIVTIA